MNDAAVLRAIFDTTPDCIKIVAQDGALLQMNSAGRAMVEAADGARLEGSSVYDLIAPEFLQAWKENHGRVCNGEKLAWEFDILGLAGARRHVETHASPLPLADGAIAQLAIMRDITPRKEAEQSTREREHYHKEMLQALPLAVYTTDLDGQITFFNEAAVEFAGRRPELGEKCCVAWRLYHPDGSSMAHDECPMALALRTGRPIRGTEGIAERPDGSRVRFAPYPTPLMDTCGRAIGAINVLVDVTERHQIHEMSARLASIVESSDDAIVSKSLDGAVTSWNSGATRIFGYDASEMVGQSITRIIPIELRDEERQILARIRRGDRVDHYETVRTRKDGGRIDISLAVSPLYDKQGAIVGASKVARDITERKQAERLQRLLLDELNHRVKNTLAIIQAIATQSLRHAKNQSDFVASFGGRLQALARAHDLLTATKLQGANLGDIIAEQVILGRSGDARVACSGPTLVLAADVTVHLALVLHELAANARKYGALSAPDGRLSVRWEVRENRRRSLFLVWEESQGPKVNAPRERGFGSTLVERTLSAHGGEATIRYDGSGVTCEICLPLAEHVQPNPLPALDTDSWPAKSDRDLQGVRIVIVEDEPLVSMELESMLKAAGCVIAGAAGTLEKAKSVSERADCDAALLDLNLSGRSAVEIAAKLTKRNIPFAFITGYGRDALPQGFQDRAIIRKPVSGGELIAVVERLVHKDPEIVQLRPRADHRL